MKLAIERKGTGEDFAESDDSELPSPRGGDESSIEILPGVPLEESKTSETKAKKQGSRALHFFDA